MIEVFLFQYIQQMSQIERIFIVFQRTLDPGRRQSGSDTHFKGDETAEFLQRRCPVAVLAAL